MGNIIGQKFFRVAKLRFLVLLSSSTGWNWPVPPKTPQEGPSGLKTVPTSIIHDYMWCWPTLGPFKYPQRPKKALFGAHEVLGGPWRSSEGPRWPDLIPTATSWSNWVGHTYIMCSGPLRDLFDTPGTPKRVQFRPFRAPQGPRRVPFLFCRNIGKWGVQSVVHLVICIWLFLMGHIKVGR